MDWEDLTKVIKHMELWGYRHLVEMKDSSKPCSYPILPRGVEAIARIQKLKRAQNGERPSMQENLMLTATAEASDPRDKSILVLHMAGIGWTRSQKDPPS